jgi:sugar lactone lactonase YvrE
MQKQHSTNASSRALIKRIGTRAVEPNFVNGELTFVNGSTNGPIDDNTLSQLKTAIARQYGVREENVDVGVKSGSIIINFTIYYGTRIPNIPTNASFIGAVSNAILNSGTTSLTFNGPATSTTLTTTSSISGTTTTQVNATSLFNAFPTTGVTLPSSPALTSVFDNAGNYFLAYPHKIYKVTPGGVVSLFAGDDIAGYADGNGPVAKFSFPLSGDYGAEMVVDLNNNLYVADTYNNRIRKIDTSGVVSTLAGSGADSDTDGTGTAAGIRQPRGITLDSAGNLFITSSLITIRQINITSKLVTTINVTTGDPSYKYVSLKCHPKTDYLLALGFKSSSDINVVYAILKRDILIGQPRGIAIDSSGNFYITSGPNSNMIRKVSPFTNDTPPFSDTLFAGSALASFSGKGSADGQGTNALFDAPFGMTIDSANNLYVADTGNHRIRKITPGGLVTTIAGSTQGSADGQGTAAQFNQPEGITIDSAGNLYVADTYNHRIRKIDTAGNVTTIAGSTRGYANGQGIAAQFNLPHGIIVKSGNLYVTDTYNNRIRKITDGNVTTIAGSGRGSANGQGIAAQFKAPFGITIDSANNLYVADTGNHRVRKITPGGLVTTIAGSDPDYSVGRNAKFNGPYGITIDSADNLYVADFGNIRIRKIDTTGNVTNIGPSLFVRQVEAGLPGPPATPPQEINGYFGDAQYQSIDRIELDPAGNIYISETPYRRIRIITSINVSTLIKDDFTIPPGTTSPGLMVPSIISIPKSGPTKLRYQIPTGQIYDFAPVVNGTPVDRIAMVSTIAGSGTQGFANGQGTAAQFSRPFAITTDFAGNFYTIERERPAAIRKIDTSGNVTIHFLDHLKYMTALFIDSYGDLYTATYDGIIDKYGLTGMPPVNLNSYVYGMTTDSNNNLYVTLTDLSIIKKITPSGNVTTFAGSTQGSADGQGTAAQFNTPLGITIDSSGNFYVCDELNHRIRKITPGGLVTTFAGFNPGFADGQGTAAEFYYPFGITIDLSDNLYVVDYGSHRIRKITPSGLVTTIAGSGEGYADGQGTAAKFYRPEGITIDRSGNLYVADTFNNRIRKITFI